MNALSNWKLSSSRKVCHKLKLWTLNPQADQQGVFFYIGSPPFNLRPMMKFTSLLVNVCMYMIKHILLVVAGGCWFHLNNTAGFLPACLQAAWGIRHPVFSSVVQLNPKDNGWSNLWVFLLGMFWTQRKDAGVLRKRWGSKGRGGAARPWFPLTVYSCNRKTMMRNSERNNHDMHVIKMNHRLP